MAEQVSGGGGEGSLPHAEDPRWSRATLITEGSRKILEGCTLFFSARLARGTTQSRDHPSARGARKCSPVCNPGAASGFPGLLGSAVCRHLLNLTSLMVFVL